MGLEFFSLQQKVVENVKEPLDLRQSNVRLSIGLLIFIIYLVIGAAVYSTIEAPAEEKAAGNLSEYVKDFKRRFVNKQCFVRGECLTALVEHCTLRLRIFLSRYSAVAASGKRRKMFYYESSTHANVDRDQRKHEKDDNDLTKKSLKPPSNHCATCDCSRPTVNLMAFGFLCLAYLTLGALMFVYLERETEERDALSLLIYLETFRTKYSSCISKDELEQLMTRVISASQRGISALQNVTYTPSWGFAQAFFFSGTLVSTVGYGSSSPVTQAGKAFTIFYCILGIPLFLVLLGGLVERLKTPSIWFMGKLNSRLGHLYKPSQIQLIHLFILFGILLLFLFIIPAGIFMGIEKKWTYLDAFYYCFISLTTIGLGDFTPGDQPQQELRSLYKIFTTGYLMVGLLCMMLFLATVYDIPQLSISRFFMIQGDSDDSERARLASKMTPGPKYMRQVDDNVMESQVSPSSTASQVATEDSYQHY